MDVLWSVNGHPVVSEWTPCGSTKSVLTHIALYTMIHSLRFTKSSIYTTQRTRNKTATKEKEINHMPSKMKQIMLRKMKAIVMTSI